MRATYLHLHTPRTGTQQQEFMKHLEEYCVQRSERAVARRDARRRIVASVQRVNLRPRRSRRPLMAV